MLVMISPVPFLFSLSFSFFLSPPLFFSLRSGFFPLSLPLPLLTPGGWGEGAREGRRGVVWMPGVFFFKSGGGGEVGEVGIFKKKKNSLRIPDARGCGGRGARRVGGP